MPWSGKDRDRKTNLKSPLFRVGGAGLERDREGPWVDAGFLVIQEKALD